MKHMEKQTRRSGGSIQKRGRRSFQIRIFLERDSKGKRKYYSETVHGSRKEAERLLRERLREKESVGLVESTPKTLNEHLDRWLKTTVKMSVRRVTLEGYESKLKTYVREGLGLRRIVDIKSHHIQDLYSQMISQGLSPKTVRHLHHIISPAFDNAIDLKLLHTNPCTKVKLPKSQRREMNCYSPEEVTIFLESARSDRYHATFAFAIETGMRPEEYLGLKWDDIDFQHSCVSVVRAVVNTKGGGFEFTEPKTPRSRRNIPLSRSLVSLLKTHRRQQLERRLRLGEAYCDLNLVFPSEVGTPTQTGNLNRRHFKKIITRAGLKEIRLYDLRHTTATLLLLKGVNPKIVSERLGHSSVSLTLDTYSHVLPTMQQGATSHLESVMFGL